jgi:hypothetical protein
MFNSCVASLQRHLHYYTHPRQRHHRPQLVLAARLRTRLCCVAAAAAAVTDPSAWRPELGPWHRHRCHQPVSVGPLLSGQPAVWCGVVCHKLAVTIPVMSAAVLYT